MNLDERFYCSKCLREMEEESVCPHCGYNPGEEPDRCFLMEGTLLHDGRYQLGAVIGKGGFGITYAAWDLVLDMPVAVKEYFPHDFSERDVWESDDVQIKKECNLYYHLGLQTFIREARILATLQNVRTVVSVYDCFEENQSAYIIMEYVRGETLLEYCKSHTVSEKAFLRMMRNTIDDLILVHKSGVLHRDISPNNMIIQEEGIVKLIDFGAATSLSIENAETFALNRSFAAPEQYEPDGEQGYWTDVYGLAATIYSVLSGETLTDAETRRASDVVGKSRIAKGKLSRRLVKVLCEALRLEPRKRTQNMEDFRADLYHMPRPIKTRKQLVLFIVMIILIVLLLEGSAAVVAHCVKTNLLQQVQISMNAYISQDADIGYRLAQNYQKSILWGEKIPQDIEKAVYWYEWAAERGSAKAALDYGLMLETGWEIEQDISQALYYYEIAMEGNEPLAFNNMGVLYMQGIYVEKDIERAMEYFQKAAEKKEPVALSNLGKVYHLGLNGMVDMEKAIDYFGEAASLGNAEAKYCLGYHYYHGFGVEVNRIETFRYWQEAADMEYGPAMYAFGEIYRTGEFGFQDYAIAIDWYERASLAGFAGGDYGLAIMYRDGLGVEIDPIKASIYMSDAFMYGFEEAQAEYEKMQEQGYGIFAEDYEIKNN